MQVIAKLATNPLVIDTLEALLVSTIVHGANSLMDSYIDSVARERAAKIINSRRMLMLTNKKQ